MARRDISQNAPDLLLESFNSLLQSFQFSKSITGDYDILPASGTDAGLGVLKFGDEFKSRVTTLGALYRQRGFAIPTSLNDRHDEPPVVDESVNPNQQQGQPKQ